MKVVEKPAAIPRNGLSFDIPMQDEILVEKSRQVSRVKTPHVKTPHVKTPRVKVKNDLRLVAAAGGMKAFDVSRPYSHTVMPLSASTCCCAFIASYSSSVIVASRA